jgi:hypothetical protein
VKYTIGQKINYGPLNNNPSPTHYHPDDAQTHEKTPQWKFSENPHAHNGPLSNPNNLGPG